MSVLCQALCLRPGNTFLNQTKHLTFGSIQAKAENRECEYSVIMQFQR